MTSYDVYLDTSSSPAFVANVAQGVYRSTYQPSPALQYDTTYSWRVDSKDISNTYTGYLWVFHTAVQVLVLTGANPATGSTDVPITTYLSWTAVPGATSYDISI